MTPDFTNSVPDPRVSAVRLDAAEYDHSKIGEALRRNCEILGWTSTSRGAFGAVIEEGSEVVVKPNLVFHENQGIGGILELVSNASIIISVVEEVLKANPRRVVVGDAPIQSCDMQRLLDAMGLSGWSERLMETDDRFGGILDFRRTLSTVAKGVRSVEEAVRPIEKFLLFNLGRESLLESISDSKNPFRVTCYDPRLLEKTHSVGNHQYLIAKEVIDADVVINLPKLKTHKKAGVTNALKNLVGINGNKEYLPHHRVGGSDGGGDCYPGSDPMKRILEKVLDQQNSASSRTTEKAMSFVSENLQRAIRLKGDETGVEGSWSGNETVARMALDLNRIVLYGNSDATLSDEVQRRVIHICDAVVAGQGDGPLAPEPFPLGWILASENAAAMDWIGATLLQYDPKKIPLLVHAFERFRWPIAEFMGRDVALLDDSGGKVTADQLPGRAATVRHPAGWRTAADARI
ncbi:MAG: DUF362 domain-containing protein [Pyrinomonadaceae bacterium]